MALFKEVKTVIRQGGLIALSGIVGCGKTTALLFYQEVPVSSLLYQGQLEEIIKEHIQNPL
ncbi:MAG TPA: hypothetical protein VK211_14750 [Kamptonema sp.]|nr:hypothetical protein [Kamptonema sp.]